MSETANKLKGFRATIDGAGLSLYSFAMFGGARSRPFREHGLARSRAVPGDESAAGADISKARLS
jgi:hypothetical protein